MNQLRLFLIENVHIIHNVGNRLGAHPINTTCFHCHQNIVTTTTTSTSTKQCLIGLLLAAVGCVQICYQCVYQNYNNYWFLNLMKYIFVFVISYFYILVYGVVRVFHAALTNGMRYAITVQTVRWWSEKTIKIAEVTP